MSDTKTTKPGSLLAEFDASELLDLLADGAYITNTDRQIVFWNQAATEITGWQASEVVGRRCRDNLLVHADKDGHELCGHEHCPLHRSIVTGRPSEEPLLVFAQHREGSRIPVEVTVSPIRNHAGEVIGGIEMFRDVSEPVREQMRAKEIQDLAVKCELPKDARVSFETCYQPRDIVGGDFYRIEKMGPDRYVVLVADVRGHGVPAALYTILLRSLWDEHRAALKSPARFLEMVNARLHGVVCDMGFFGTAVLVSYHAVSGKLEMVRAGHPAPLRFGATGPAEALGTANPALGLNAAQAYVATAAQLQPGDSLLLYTDGATELFDAGDHELGREGLIEIVRSQLGASGTGFRLDQLEERLLQFSNQIHLPDDLTLVKIHRTRAAS